MSDIVQGRHARGTWANYVVFDGIKGEESGMRSQSEGFISDTQQGKHSGGVFTCAFEVKENCNNVRRGTGLQEKSVSPRCGTRNDFDPAVEMQGSVNATESEGSEEGTVQRGTVQEECSIAFAPVNALSGGSEAMENAAEGVGCKERGGLAVSIEKERNIVVGFDATETEGAAVGSIT